MGSSFGAFIGCGTRHCARSARAKHQLAANSDQSRRCATPSRPRKASGQPDWPTRVAAVKTLAALRPDELEQVEPENEQQPTPSIVVYDLPPGAGPVVHRATSGGETPVSAA